MTTTVLAGLLKTAGRNVGLGAGSFGLFETATVTVPSGAGTPILPVDRRPSVEEFAALDAGLPAQPLHLALVGVGEADGSGWWGEGRGGQGYDAVDAVRAVAGSVALEVTALPADLAPWHPGRCAELSIEGDVIGHAGELHPKVCAAYGLPRGSVAAEVDLDVVAARAVHLRRAPSFSTQPVA